MTAWVIVAVLAVAALAVASVVISASASEASTSQYISVDVLTDGNERDAIGQIDSCTSVEEGEEFGVDVAIRDVENLVAWELRFEFNSAVVEVAAVDHDQFLLSNDGDDIRISPRLLDVENPDRIFIGAGEVRGNPDSGSGVLARLTIRAKEPGVSHLRISSQPVVRAPRLANDLGMPIGDENGDGLWDSGITNAQVAVGGSCDDLVPIPTPPPLPSSPPDSSGNSPGSSADVDSDSTGGGSGGNSVSGDSGFSGSDGSGSDGNTTGAGSDDGDEAASAEGGDDEAPGNGSPSSGAGDGGGSGLGNIPLVIGGLALAVVALGAGTLFVFRSRGTW